MKNPIENSDFQDIFEIDSPVFQKYKIGGFEEDISGWIELCSRIEDCS